MQKNYKALNALYYPLDVTEFNKIFVCGTNKEVWYTLVTIYEEISQVKEHKISFYV